MKEQLSDNEIRMYRYKRKPIKIIGNQNVQSFGFFLISTEGRNSQRENAIKERLYELEYVS